MRRKLQEQPTVYAEAPYLRDLPVEVRRAILLAAKSTTTETYDCPTTVPAGVTYVVRNDKQVLYTLPIDNCGYLEVLGYLVEI